MPSARLRVDPQLWFLLRPDRRRPAFEVAVTATDTVGHVVQMVGVPLTEVGTVRLDGRTVKPASPLRSSRPGGLGRSADPAPPLDRESRHEAVGIPTVDVAPRERPQRTRTTPPRFLLDVHLGSLARRLRLLGLDTAYEVDADDDHLLDRATTESRVLLTRDRGLLSRTALPEGALVRGFATQEQLEDVLDRFAPSLAPWTRCVRCNGVLGPVPAEEVAREVEQGTRRSYRIFSRCAGCGRVYWRGAHAGPLEDVVRRAEAVVAGRAAGVAGQLGRR